MTSASGAGSLSAPFLSAHAVLVLRMFLRTRNATIPPQARRTCPSQNSVSLTRVAYYLARAARRNWMQSVSLDGVGPFTRKSGNGEGGISFGSFEVKGDSRQLEVQNFVHFQLFISIFTF